MAGPIVRFRQIEKDLESIASSKRAEDSETGWSFFALGMIKKVLIADSLAAIVDPALAGYHELSTLTTWMCMLGYPYQLYFDFSGYCGMAVGLGFLFGLRLPQNFNSPYKAVSIIDFWRRWHISLSTVLRDYLYIPLGGNRNGTAASYRNVIITMLLGGLWHGANWTFVIWGAYHGALIVAQRLAGKAWNRLSSGVASFVTFVAVTIGWVFFRSQDFSMAASILRSMFVWKSGPWIPTSVTLAALLLLAGLLAHRGPNTSEIDHRWTLPGRIGIVMLFVACVVTIYGARSSPFLYFQF